MRNQILGRSYRNLIVLDLGYKRWDAYYAGSPVDNQGDPSPLCLWDLRCCMWKQFILFHYFFLGFCSMNIPQSVHSLIDGLSCCFQCGGLGWTILLGTFFMCPLVGKSSPFSWVDTEKWGCYVVLSLTFHIALVCLLTLLQGTPLASCGPALGVLPSLGHTFGTDFSFLFFFWLPVKHLLTILSFFMHFCFSWLAKQSSAHACLQLTVGSLAAQDDLQWHIF